MGVSLRSCALGEAAMFKSCGWCIAIPVPDAYIPTEVHDPEPNEGVGGRGGNGVADDLLGLSLGGGGADEASSKGQEVEAAPLKNTFSSTEE